jgi:DNA-binding transcriptional LysR family regulator
MTAVSLRGGRKLGIGLLSRRMAFDLTDLRLFLQVVDGGSITRGAERTHLALASASARISSMEKALGAPLLVRHRRGVLPSPAGWLLVAHARLIVERLARMESELARFADGQPSTLVFLANTSATETFAAAAVTEYMRDQTDIDVELKELPSEQIVAAVTNGNAELGLIADTVDVGRLECRMVRPDPLVVVTRRDHEVADRARISFSECLDHPFVGYVEGNPLQEHLSGRSHPLGRRPRYRARLPETEAICRAVSAGVGIAVLPALAASRWRGSLDLVMVPLTNTWAQRALILCSRRWSELSRPASALAEHVMMTGGVDHLSEDGRSEGQR